MALLNLLFSLLYSDFKNMLTVSPFAGDVDAPALCVLVVKDGHFVTAKRAYYLYFFLLFIHADLLIAEKPVEVAAVHQSVNECIGLSLLFLGNR